MDKIITPRRLNGFVELSPEKQLQFDEMKNKIIDVFNRHAFMPLDTPILELSEILLAKSGGDIDKEVYRFSKGSTDMCMRYDLTVPLARYVAMNLNDLNFPFKRYQIGKVFRGERPQKGRLREFYQCDADIIGNEQLSLVNDADCVCLFSDCFKALNLDSVVEISNRKLINGLIKDLKLTELSEEIFKTLDKLDKIGEDGVRATLLAAGVNQQAADKLLLLGKNKGSLKDILPKIQDLSNSEEYKLGLQELSELDSYLTAMGLTENDYIYNLSIIRGHNYYTGTVFEAFLKGHRDFGAVGGGGRYDNLASYYTTTKLPGVGMSIGLSRLFDQLLANNLLPSVNKTSTKVLLIPLGDTVLFCLNLCKDLRNNNIVADVLSENKSFKAKMKDANKKGVPYIIVVGDDEVKTQTFALKNMSTGEQENLTKENLIKKMQR